MYGTVEVHQPASTRRWWRRLIRFAVVGGMGGKKTPAPVTQHPVNSSFCFVQNKTFSISREQYKCPKCGEQKLRFQLEALYD
jgi:hypothetical protein